MRITSSCVENGRLEKGFEDGVQVETNPDVRKVGFARWEAVYPSALRDVGCNRDERGDNNVLEYANPSSLE